MTNFRRWLIIILVSLVLLGGLLLLFHRGKSQKTVGIGQQIPQEAQQTVSLYLQAQENAVGADQASPTSWLATVKPLTTNAWYASIQPASNESTGDASGDYLTAHNNHYIIKTTVTGCSWVGIQTQTMGTMTCSLTDSVFSQINGAQVQAISLPFGWVHNGLQIPPTVSLINQNGKWLIDKVVTDQQSPE